MERKKVIIIDTDPAKKSLSELRKDVGTLREAISTMDKGTQEYDDTLKQLNDSQNRISSIMNATKQTATALEGSYNALTFQMSQLKEQWKATNDEAEREALGKQINTINDKLKALDASTGNFQRNVGNYAGAFTDAMGTMGGSCNGLVAGINSIRKGFDLLKSHPLIAIVAVAVTVLMKIVDALKKNEEHINKITLAFAPLKAVGTIITNIMDKLAGYIADAIAKLGDLSKWIEKVGKKFAKFLRGLGWDDFADSLERGFDKLAATSAEEERLIKKEQALAKRKREILIENAKLELQASEAHAKTADKENLTLEERQKNLEIYAARQKKIAANNLEIAKTELEIAEARSAQAPNDAAANDALAQAQAKVYQEQIAYNNTLRSITAERNKLWKEDAKEKKEEAKEEKDLIKEEQNAIKERLKGLKDEYTNRANAIKDYINNEKLLWLNKLKDGEVTQKEYNEALKKIDIDANISRLESAKAFLDELKGIEDENITSTSEYASLISATLDTITSASEEQLAQQSEHIEEYTDLMVASLDITQQTLSELASIGDGVSSKWADSIGRVSNLVNVVSDTLKTGEKGWKAYGSIAAASLNVVGSMLGALADEQDTTTREGFEKQKKLQIGQATMNMLSGILAAWTSAMALPAPASFILGAIETAATAALGGAQIAMLAKQTFDSSSSASGAASTSSAATSSVVAPVQYTQDVQGASIEESIGNQKVYVTETDIKDTSNKVDVAESEARY